MNLKPLGNRVVVERLESSDRTPGGIHLPDVAKEKPRQGRVLAVGPGAYRDGAVVPVAVRVGDRVLFGAYAGSEVTVDGKDYLVVTEDEVLAVVGAKP